MEHLLNVRATTNEDLQARPRWFGTISALFQGFTSKTTANSKFQEKTGLSLDSAILLKKVQRRLNDDWANALHRTVQVTSGPGKQWSSAVTCHVAELQQSVTQSVAPSQPVSAEAASPMAATPPDSRTKDSQAPARDEEIRGLDDIFPAPIDGLFLDEAHRKQHQSATSQASAPMQEPGIADYADEDSALAPPPRSLPGTPPPEPENPLLPPAERVIAWIEQRINPAKNAVTPVMELFQDAVAAPSPQKADVSDVLPAQPPRDTVQSSAPSLETPAESPSDAARIRRTPPPPKSQSPVRMLGDLPLERPLDDDLGRDLSSCDHMLRSNKILANSITSLVDAYFQKAALEEETAYY